MSWEPYAAVLCLALAGLAFWFWPTDPYTRSKGERERKWRNEREGDWTRQPLGGMWVDDEGDPS